MNKYRKEMIEKDEEIYRLRKMVDRLFESPKKITKTEEKIIMPYIKEGTLFQRKDKRWEAKLYVDGKQVTIACAKWYDGNQKPFSSSYYSHICTW